ncbi:DUF6584 family protein [Aquipuribacter sp. SD81]|uniref:DUF6584 family protein n=1 Tax=Aquipuribacter sp. SD81 TaxID=3127703 RepID=UPI0030181806
MDALEHARHDLAAGRPWLARDRLLGTLGTRHGDRDALLLLGEVHLAMNDLPAAGAAWLLTDRDDAAATTAADAFRERYRKPAARAERLPMHRPLTEYPPDAVARVRALRAELTAEGWTWHPPARAQPPGRARERRHRDSFPEVDAPPRGWPRRLRDIGLGALLVYLVVGFLAVWVIGFVTALRWIWG